VITFEHGTHKERNHATATFALDLVNKLIVDNKDILTPPFLQARFFLRDNLVLATGLNHNNLDHEAYFSLICEALKPIGYGSVCINEKWTKFLFHGVPT
jgi:hypothetical protein